MERGRLKQGNRIMKKAGKGKRLGIWNMAKRAEKGQVAVEYLVIIIVMLGIVGVIFLYSMNAATQAIMIDKTQNAVKTIANAVDLVYASGPGAKVFVQVDLPDGISGQIMSNNEIGYSLLIGSAATDIYEAIKAEAIGELPTSEGLNLIAVEMLDSGIVRIGSGFVLTPTSVLKTITPGNSDSTSFSAWNTSGEELTGVINSTSEGIVPFTTLGGISETLDLNATDTFSATYVIPSGTSAGLYTGYVEVSSEQGYMDKSLVRINVPHVLNNVNVDFYSDIGYSAASQSFSTNDVVYYEIRTFDQTAGAMNLNDLNVYVKNPAGSDVNVFLGESTSSGSYTNTFRVPCAGAAGTWTVQGNASAYEYVSDSNTFTVAGALQSSYFEFDWSTSSFTGGNKRLVEWTITNSGCDTVTITDMNVAWFNDADHAVLNKIKLNNAQVWSGTSAGNAWLDIIDTPIGVGESWGVSEKNELWFDTDPGGAINDESEDFVISFRFSDASVETTPIYAP